MASPAASMPSVESRFAEAFPNSRKVHVEGERVRVPMREIALSAGEPPLRVYDTSGPHGADVRAGLAPLRRDWIAGRGGTSPRSCRRAGRTDPSRYRHRCTGRSCAARGPSARCTTRARAR